MLDPFLGVYVSKLVPVTHVGVIRFLQMGSTKISVLSRESLRVVDCLPYFELKITEGSITNTMFFCLHLTRSTTQRLDMQLFFQPVAVS